MIDYEEPVADLENLAESIETDEDIPIFTVMHRSYGMELIAAMDEGVASAFFGSDPVDEDEVIDLPAGMDLGGGVELSGVDAPDAERDDRVSAPAPVLLAGNWMNMLMWNRLARFECSRASCRVSATWSRHVRFEERPLPETGCVGLSTAYHTVACRRHCDCLPALLNTRWASRCSAMLSYPRCWWANLTHVRWTLGTPFLQRSSNLSKMEGANVFFGSFTLSRCQCSVVCCA